VTAGAGGRGWLTVGALALVTAVFSVVSPAILIGIPLALLLVALPPRHPVMLALSAFLLWLTLRMLPGDPTTFYLTRGWALLAGAWFVLLVGLFPEWRFLPRALGAVAGSIVTAGAMMALRHGSLAPLDAAVTARVEAGAGRTVDILTRAAGDGRLNPELARGLAAATELQVALYPALLALGTVAALGVAWWVFNRAALHQGSPLGSLREFRFRDDLVWVFIAGILLLVLPLGELAHRAGENLFTFMAVLYALRGAAVLLVIGGVPGPMGVVLGVLLIVLLYPIVMATTFVVGLFDTWFDIRARRRAPTNPGS
jgi:hypothetical protein